MPCAFAMDGVVPCTANAMPGGSRTLVHTRFTKPSRLSIVDQGVLQSRKLRRSNVSHKVVASVVTGGIRSSGLTW